jgi:hypothetical protein
MIFGESKAPALAMEITNATFFRGSDVLFVVRYFGNDDDVVVLIAKLADLYAIERISPAGGSLGVFDPSLIACFPGQ